MKARFSPTSNREDWGDQYTVRDLTTGQLIDLTGANITLTISRRYGVTFTFDLTSGVTIAGLGQIVWTIPASTMNQLAPGNYAVGCVMSRAGSTTQIFTGVLPVIDGVTP